jgi:hypothetical protein
LLGIERYLANFVGKGSLQGDSYGSRTTFGLLGSDIGTRIGAFFVPGVCCQFFPLGDSLGPHHTLFRASVKQAIPLNDRRKITLLLVGQDPWP